jgi:pyruvate kinase
MIEKLFLSGADIFRLNFSHGEHPEKANLVKLIRQVEKKYDHPIGILGDLQLNSEIIHYSNHEVKILFTFLYIYLFKGPKLRVGIFEGDKVSLVPGQTFVLDYHDEPGTPYRVRLPHPEILHTLKAGDIVLFDDGKLKMEVEKTTIDPINPDVGQITCKVIVGGILSTKKGVNTPSIVLPISPLTPKDQKDIAFILTLEIDWGKSLPLIFFILFEYLIRHIFKNIVLKWTVALSFVQKPEDVAELKAITGNKVKIMAKLEKPSAIKRLEEIVDIADAIMVARGDLGVEMHAWDVPIIQKRILECCNKRGKPVVVATQMMESMIENPTPTRAEASDCATAIFDSADAVMLSAESAAGKYPVEAVTMQQLIINRVETDEVYLSKLDRFNQDYGSKQIINNAITLAARQVAEISKSKAILAFTSSGSTVMRVARVRPKVPIIAACYDIETARKLTLVWGVYPILIDRPDHEFNLREELLKACSVAVKRGFCSPETDLMTVTAGLPFGVPGTTNVVRIVSAAGPDYWFDDKGSGQMKYFHSETFI